MIWYVKKIEENEDHIIIEFSKSVIYDGRIRYDRKRECFTAISIPKDCDEFDRKRLFQFLYGLIDQNKISFNLYSIRTG